MAKKKSPENITIGALLRQYREKAKLTQKEFADIIGYENPQFVSLIENGHSKVPLNVLGQIIKVLKIPERKVLDVLLETYEKDVLSQISGAGKRSAS